MTIVFIPKERRAGETRVAAVPATVKRLVQAKCSVLVEHSAGVASFVLDTDFETSGAEIVSDYETGATRADVVLAVNALEVTQVDSLKEGAFVVSFLYAESDEVLLRKFIEKKVSVIAINKVPRITRAQKLDALSSQSNLAGYKAVLLGAAQCPKMFPLMMTAAGTIRPARVVILGAGVAGLQAIATAKRLGAIVEVSDIRPIVKEQVQSLGAEFIEVPTDEDLETEGGYAKEASPEFLKKQSEITQRHIIAADVVITTALIPGRPAPRLISADVVEQMRNGAVIVDLAAEQGGNCELTAPGEICVQHGVTIVGTLNLAGTLPINASELYARNLLNLVLDQFKDGELVWDLDDEVIDQSLLIHCGGVRDAAIAKLLDVELVVRVQPNENGAHGASEENLDHSENKAGDTDEALEGNAS